MGGSDGTRHGDVARGMRQPEAKPTDAQRELREAPERIAQLEMFERAFNAAPNPVFIVRARDRRLVWVNDAFVSESGYPHAQIVGQVTMEVGLYPHGDWHQKIWEGLQSGGRVRGLEVEIVTASGEKRTMLVSINVVDIHGEPHAVGITENITARKHAEDQLRLSEERLKMTLEASRTGWWDYTVVGEEVRCEASLCQVIGGEPLEMPSSREALRALVHPDDMPDVDRAYAEHVADPAAVLSCVCRVSAGAGEWRWVQLRGKVVAWDDRGKPARVAGTLTDVHEMKLAEAALLDSEFRFQSLVQKLSDAILVLGPDATILQDTPSVERMLGYAPGFLVGKSGFEFVHPDDIGVVQREFVRVAQRTNSGIPTEFRALRADGSCVSVESVADNMLDLPGVGGLVVILRDISERKRIAEERQAMEMRIQHMQKLESLATVAGGIAHDFNNLLTGVIGNAMLALDALPADSPTHASIEQAVLAARRAAELTKQMLTYAGGDRLSAEPVELSGLVEEMVGLLRASISKKCELHCDFADDLPILNGDPSQLRQVVMNLILNASEAMGSGSGVITVRTRAEHCDRGQLSGSHFGDELDEGMYLCLEVTDTGCGIAPELKASIFDPYFSTKFTGRGLGLAAVFGIVRSHRGAIHVQSEPGTGTSFRVFFPAANEAIQARDASGSTRGDAVRLGTVLVIDDEEIVRKVAAAMLRQAGFSVIEASDGEQGVEVMRRNRDCVQVVLLDLMMPKMNGHEAIERLQAIRKDVGIVLTSGYTKRDATRGLATERLAGFVQKPYTSEELVDVVAQAMRAR